ncbi:hypothetical protein L6164_029812 [Bauhinia variegata]|uniref:Uncharacterized protein n=1 Tax=Bauhinia variegata TaxID=167791 RepID=A0ACB9LA97_BAUVA|nr:hypothetical protein L6164_029812 [Bauhinia variegata]
MASHLPLPSLLLIFLLLVSSSSARLFVTFASAATRYSTLDIALPADNVNGMPEKKEAGRVMPCDMEAAAGKSSPEIKVRAPRVAGKYGPLVLNMLPKGPVTPSGPSKKINHVIN